MNRTPVRAALVAVLVCSLRFALGAPVASVPAPRAGTLERHPAFGSSLVEAREVDVWLPPGYGGSPGARYPVIYMQDGQNLFDHAASFGGASWDIGVMMESLLRAGRVRPAIVVGIWNAGAARAAEYIPQKGVKAQREDQVSNSYSGAHIAMRSDAYLKFVVTELKPWVDRTYRTAPGAGDTFIMGSSMGGLISVYAVAEYPGVFGGAACLSTHWIAGDGTVVDYLRSHMPAPGSNRFYFDHGTVGLDAGYGPGQEQMDAIMRDRGYAQGRDWVTRTFPGADHSETSWSRRVDQPLEFLLGK